MKERLRSPACMWLYYLVQIHFLITSLVYFCDTEVGGAHSAHAPQSEKGRLASLVSSSVADPRLSLALVVLH